MKRQIRVQVNFVAEVDDDRDGVPFVADPSETLRAAARVILPNAAGILPGGRLSLGLTRRSLTEARRARRKQHPGKAGA